MLEIVKKQAFKMRSVSWWAILLVLSLIPVFRKSMLKFFNVFGKVNISSIFAGEFVFATMVIIYYLFIFIRMFVIPKYCSDVITEQMCYKLSQVVFNTPVIWLQLFVFIENIGSLGKRTFSFADFEFYLLFLIQTVVVVLHLLSHTTMEDKIFD